MYDTSLRIVDEIVLPFLISYIAWVVNQACMANDHDVLRHCLIANWLISLEVI